MNLGVRGKLFLISVGLILSVGLASVVFLEIQLRDWLEAGIEQEVYQQVELVREAILISDGELNFESADQLADRLAASTEHARVSIIRNDGVVLGDSQLDGEDLLQIENHADRPEVTTALNSGEGHARRYSSTVDGELLYVALPFQKGDVTGVVRVSWPLSEVDTAVERLRLLLLLACGIGLFLAVFMSGLASHLMSRTVRSLVSSARAIASGEHERVDVSSKDELGRLAGSLNLIAEEMEDVVGTLATERNRFEAVLEGIGEAVIAVNNDQKITLVNSAARRLLRLDDDTTGSGVLDLMGVTSLNKLMEDASKGQTAQIEFDLQDKRIMANINPHPSGGAVVVMHDVTRLRRLETIRRDFVANVSHELRTPVSVIRANAETLLDGAMEENPEVARRFVGAILRNSERLSMLVVDLLDIARIEAGKYVLEPEVVVVENIANVVLENIETKAREKGMVIENELTPGLRALADTNALEHVLINLLENAVKYTPDSGQVVIRSRRMNGSVRIEVEDNGRGVKAKHRQRIFERFYRADKGRARSMGGTGLGLSIVKNLVTRMGGQVGFEPAQPRGSIFWFELPAVDEPGAADDLDEGTDKPVATAP